MTQPTLCKYGHMYIGLYVHTYKQTVHSYILTFVRTLKKTGCDFLFQSKETKLLIVI